jgi:hypothetical protein
VRGAFRLDGDSGQLEARLSFGLVGRSYVGSLAKGGLSVTDVYWRALGRDWLPESGGWTDFDGGDLEARYGVREVYLAVGLTRSYEGNLKPIILGVHTLPECDVALDCDNL